MRRTVEALGTAIAVNYDDGAPFVELVEVLLGGYTPTRAAPELIYELACDRVARAGLERRVDDPIDIVPIFELDLYREVVKRAPPGWILHAAVVELNGVIVVFAGPSGAGKTTLTLALDELGASILTEEIVCIDRTLGVRGLARPIHLSTGVVPRTWRSCVYPMRTERGVVEHTIAIPPKYITEMRTLDILLQIQHGRDVTSGLTSLPTAEAFELLWNNCTLRQDDHGLSVAVAVLNLMTVSSLTSNSVQSAVALVRERTAG